MQYLKNGFQPCEHLLYETVLELAEKLERIFPFEEVIILAEEVLWDITFQVKIRAGDKCSRCTPGTIAHELRSHRTHRLAAYRDFPY